MCLQDGQKLMEAFATDKCPRTFVIVPEYASSSPKTKDAAEVKGIQEKLSGWVGGMSSVFSRNDNTDADVERSLLSKCTEDRYRLFLVCEWTGERVNCGPDGQGYIISAPKATIKKYLPAMQIGFKALAFFNGAVEIAKCIYPLPVPTMTSNFKAEAQGMLKTLQGKSSAESFSCVQKAFDAAADNDPPKNQVRARQIAFQLYAMYTM